jgi:hypothetical protein
LAVFAVLCAGTLYGTASAGKGASGSRSKEKTVQAQLVLTVSESKRLIAKAVAKMPIVREALANGMIIIAKGTTNTYVAEELLGRKIPHGAYVYGRTYPVKGAKRLKETEKIAEVILVKGEQREDLSLEQAVRKLKPGDVVIKGANALDYRNKTAAVITGSSSAGTTGTIMPYVVARKAHLVIPVGLEKEVAGDPVDIFNKMREPIESLNTVHPMFLLTGHIVTELEALPILTGVSAFQSAAGGIGGAEGAVRIVCRGPRENVEKALKLAGEIHGEQPFVD